MGEYYYPVLFTEWDTKKKLREYEVTDLYHVDGTTEHTYCNYRLEDHCNVKTYYSHDYKEKFISDGHECTTTVGLKMMEHAYFGNRMVNHVMYDIMMNSRRDHSVTRLIWMSDYGMDRSIEPDFKHKSLCEIAQAIPSRWLCDKLKAKVDDSCPLTPPELGYIQNLDKDEWITVHRDRINESEPDLEKYWNDNINPLPLLTQFNKGGGGNYRGTNMDLLGTWALDKLRYVRFKPTEGTCLDGKFREE